MKAWKRVASLVVVLSLAFLAQWEYRFERSRGFSAAAEFRWRWSDSGPIVLFYSVATGKGDCVGVAIYFDDMLAEFQIDPVDGLRGSISGQRDPADF